MMRTSDGTWRLKNKRTPTHGTGSKTSDVGVGLNANDKPNPFVKHLAGESSLPMRVLSRIVPGLDPTAEMHDPFVQKVGDFMPGFTGLLYNQGTIPLAYGITVAGALYDPSLLGTYALYDDE